MISKDVLGLRDMSTEDIFEVITLAEKMKKKIDDPTKRDDSLKHVSAVTLFYENSTRTSMSFKLAGNYLGACVSDLGVSGSSVSKGESLVDTGVTIDQMGIDVIIIRHFCAGAAHTLARNVKASVINAGDGTNEHPSQALLDLLSIYEKKKSFANLKVAIIGDISHSRVARSNAFGLTKLGAKVTLCGPTTLLASSMKTLGAELTSDLKLAVADADVVMGLRIQLERQKAGPFPDLREYTEFFGINEEMLSYAKKDVLIMHPGPVNRGVEMPSEIVDSEKSLINEQVKNGVAVRMALLSLLQNRRLERRK